MKRKKTKLIIIFAAVCLFITSGWLAMPSNLYVRRALTNFMPKIDQYPIFENRVIKAGDPQSWEYAEYYNKLSIPEKYNKDFDKLGTVAYVIIQNGKLLFEQYWEDYSPQSHSNAFSMAKSIVSLAIGCAIEDGLIKSIDQPVSDFFPQFEGYNGKTLTIRHLLTMSAGFDFNESYSSLLSPTTELYYGNDVDKVTFGMKEIEEPGINFVYQSGVTQLLSAILEKATGENISSYVSRKIWTPIQAEENALWSLDNKDGKEKSYCCFNSNARDFARFGQLILNEGRWNGKQVVPGQYVKEAITADSSLIYKDYNTKNRYYGYQFWMLEKNGMKIPYMRGMLGQYVFCIPEKDAVVVRLGHKRGIGYTEDQHYPSDIDIWLDAALEMLDETPKRARFIFAGDLMQHQSQLNAARKEDGTFDYSESYQFVKPLFEEADLAFVNLETTLTTLGRYTGYPIFRSPKEVATTLRDIGIDVALLANNHILDAGRTGVLSTLALLDSANVKHIGVYADKQSHEKNHPLMLNVNGLRIAVLNYTYSTNGLPVPSGIHINMLDSAAIVRDIKSIDRTKTDVIIANFHWGDEYARRPNAEQRKLSELCHSLGVEIIIGAHPHVVQPVSYQKDKDMITVYSLGNLVSNQRFPYTDGGLIVAIDVVKEKDQRLKIKPEYIPIWVKLPKYKILTTAVGDTMKMTDAERRDYEECMKEIKEIVPL